MAMSRKSINTLSNEFYMILDITYPFEKCDYILFWRNVVHQTIFEITMIPTMTKYLGFTLIFVLERLAETLSMMCFIKK